MSGYKPSHDDSWDLVDGGSVLQMSLPISRTLYDPAALLLGNPKLRKIYRKIPGGVDHPAMSANKRSALRELKNGQAPSHKLSIPLPVTCVDVSTIEGTDVADEGAPMVSEVFLLNIQKSCALASPLSLFSSCSMVMKMVIGE